MTPEADRDSTPHRSFPYHAGWRAMACGAFFFGVLGGVGAAMLPVRLRTEPGRAATDSRRALDHRRVRRSDVVLRRSSRFTRGSVTQSRRRSYGSRPTSLVLPAILRQRTCEEEEVDDRGEPKKLDPTARAPGGDPVHRDPHCPARERSSDRHRHDGRARSERAIAGDRARHDEPRRLRRAGNDPPRQQFRPRSLRRHPHHDHRPRRASGLTDRPPHGRRPRPVAPRTSTRRPAITPTSRPSSANCGRSLSSPTWRAARVRTSSPQRRLHRPGTAHAVTRRRRDRVGTVRPHCRASSATSSCSRNSAAAAWASSTRPGRRASTASSRSKMVREAHLATDADRARFRTEAEAAARLKHPNIVTVYEVGTVDGQAYLCMEYVGGQTLAERVRADGPAPAARGRPARRASSPAPSTTPTPTASCTGT